MLEIKNIDESYRKKVVDILRKSWGSNIIVTKGKIHNTEKLHGFIAIEKEEIKGIITYDISENECEIVTLDSLSERRGIGKTLILHVETLAENNNCSRIWLITTNDNTNAIRYYQRCGFNMIALYTNAINESRKIKIEIPETGYDEIPILHEIEFEKKLK